MKTIIALIAVTFVATGCASAPSTPLTIGDYCKGQARIVAARAQMQDFGPLVGRPAADAESTVYRDCVLQVASH